jgi:uncharacterized membrane protein
MVHTVAGTQLVINGTFVALKTLFQTLLLYFGCLLFRCFLILLFRLNIYLSRNMKDYEHEVVRIYCSVLNPVPTTIVLWWVLLIKKRIKQRCNLKSP